MSAKTVEHLYLQVQAAEKEPFAAKNAVIPGGIAAVVNSPIALAAATVANSLSAMETENGSFVVVNVIFSAAMGRDCPNGQSTV